MKIFISWSGETSKAIAEILYTWLPSVIQAVKPFFSPDDIAKGARWSSEVGSELEACQVGIIIVTREALSSSWIMFEAGALSKNIGKAKVAPILVGLEPADIQGPLMQFQCARFDRAEIKRVLRMINSELRDLSLTDDVLESVFTMWWPKLETQVAQSLRQANMNVPAPQRTEKELLEEILGLTRSIAKNQAEKKEPLPPEVDDGYNKFSGTLTVAAVRERLGSGGNLAGANMMDLNLARLDLSGANLRGANLVLANLSHASLVNADLDGANLEGAILDWADLRGAKISRTNLWRASMYSVQNLTSVKSMDNANFFEVEMDDENRKIVAEHKTLSFSNYRSLFDHYLESGMTKAELQDLFLWIAHSYPGETL
jgi:Pentapeptide repeats (8 copies)/TIR domain